MSVTIIFLLLYTLSLHIWLSTTIGSVLLIILCLANHFVVSFRGNALTPFDFLAIQTAKNVADSYHFSLYSSQIASLVIWFLFVLNGWYVLVYRNRKEKPVFYQRKWRVRMILSLAEIILIAVWFLGCSNMYVYTWGNEGAVYNGYLLNFSAQITDILTDEKPSDYSTEKIATLEEEFKSLNNNEDATPHVLVIMNESYADLEVVGDLQLSNDVDSFYESIQDNVIKGYALSSVFGGTTANSEYEFLTSNSMGYLNSSASPYQFYIKDNCYSVVRTFKELGYSCIATHPYNASGWSRTKVYPLLGFEEYTFIEDYPNKNLIRDYISDREMYEYMISKFERRKDEEKLFLFGITMQNHGGYTYDGEGYTPSVDLEGFSQDYQDAEQYLGLLQESDKALEYLITYFENVEEDVVVVFFGDHLPGLNESFYEELHGGPFDTLDEQMLKYKVPFFIWANYDIEEREVDCTSLNFLSNYMYEAAGIELPAYNAFLQEVNGVIPAMNAYGYFSKSQNRFIPYEDAKGKEAEMLDAYNILQYNSMFDEKNRSEVFFPIRLINILGMNLLIERRG